MILTYFISIVIEQSWIDTYFFLKKMNYLPSLVAIAGSDKGQIYRL